MQFQSDMIGVRVGVSEVEELSGMGAAYMAGISAGLYDRERIFEGRKRNTYRNKMPAEEAGRFYEGWKKAVAKVLKTP